MKKTFLIITFLLMFSTVSAVSNRDRPLANENKAGIYAKSIEHVLRLDADEIDLGTAALIVAEEWSDIVHGRRYLEELDDIAFEIRTRLEEKNLQNSYKAVQVINDYLFNELGFESVKEAADPNDLFLHSVMDRKKGYCLSLSILYLSLAERLGLPLYGVVVPGHFFVRYDNEGRVRFNIETTSRGGFAADEHYKKTFNVPEDDGDGIYMRNLNKLQTLGCLFNNLGNVYSDIGDTDTALLAFERAIEINPSLAESRTNLGNIYLQQDKINDAIYQYRQALAINPDDAKAYNNLGNAYAKRRWLGDAISAYSTSLELDSNSADTYMNLAAVYSKKQMFSRAASLLREAVTIEPGNSDIYTQLGNLYSQKQDYERAMSEYKKALQLNSKSASAHYGTAICYNKLGMVKNEIRSYKNALAVQPDMAEALVNLGNAYFSQKKYDKAIEQYNKAAALKPNDNSIQYNLGAAYSNNGQYTQAVEAYKEAVAIDPAMGDAHNGLAFVYYKLKNYALAWQHIQSAEQSGIEIDNELLKAIKRKVH